MNRRFISPPPARPRCAVRTTYRLRQAPPQRHFRASAPWTAAVPRGDGVLPASCPQSRTRKAPLDGPNWCRGRAGHHRDVHSPPGKHEGYVHRPCTSRFTGPSGPDFLRRNEIPYRMHQGAAGSPIGSMYAAKTRPNGARRTSPCERIVTGNRKALHCGTQTRIGPAFAR